MELVTGRAGSPHITAQQDRQKHQGIWGDGAYILATGNQLEPEVQSSNKILIKDGALMSQGALFSVKVGTTDEVMINNGNQGMKRKDLIVARYTYDSAQNKESAEWVVIQGTPAASNPVLPSGIIGDIQAGDATADTPFLAVTLDGINIVSVEVIPEVAPDIPTLNAILSKVNSDISSQLTQIYNANNNTIHAKKIGNIVFARFSIQMPDTTERTLTFNSEFAPSTSGFSIPLARNGELAGSAWLSKSGENGALTYKAADNNFGSYTCTTFWFTN